MLIKKKILGLKTYTLKWTIQGFDHQSIKWSKMWWKWLKVLGLFWGTHLADFLQVWNYIKIKSWGNKERERPKIWFPENKASGQAVQLRRSRLNKPRPSVGWQRWQAEKGDYKSINHRAGGNHKIGSLKNKNKKRMLSCRQFNSVAYITVEVTL